MTNDHINVDIPGHVTATASTSNRPEIVYGKIGVLSTKFFGFTSIPAYSSLRSLQPKFHTAPHQDAKHNSPQRPTQSDARIYLALDYHQIRRQIAVRIWKLIAFRDMQRKCLAMVCFLKRLSSRWLIASAACDMQHNDKFPQYFFFRRDKGFLPAGLSEGRAAASRSTLIVLVSIFQFKPSVLRY